MTFQDILVPEDGVQGCICLGFISFLVISVLEKENTASAMYSSNDE